MGRRKELIKWHSGRGYYIKLDPHIAKQAGKAYQYLNVTSKADKDIATAKAFDFLSMYEGQPRIAPSLRVDIKPAEVSAYDFKYCDGDGRIVSVDDYVNGLPTNQQNATRDVLRRFFQWQQSFRIKPTMGTVADFERLERERTDQLSAERVGRDALGMVDDIPAKQTLSTILTDWQELRRTDTSGPHITDVSAIFRKLIDRLGDKAINLVTAQDIADFRLWVKRQAKKQSKNPPTYYNNHSQRIAEVFRSVREWKPSYPFPADLDTMLSYRKLASQAGDKHKEAPEVDTFRKLLAYLDVDTDPLAVKFAALTRLAAQTGFLSVDAERLTWERLTLDDAIPYVDFPRVKSEKKTGKANARRIPLLPSTVKALLKWQAVSGRKTGKVFTFACRVGVEFDRLQKLAETERFMWKQLRNVAGEVTADNADSVDFDIEYLKARLLGQSMKTTAGKHYTATHKTRKPAVLMPLIDLIGAAYFNGDKVGSPTLSIAS